jgi:hypothetical protein
MTRISISVAIAVLALAPVSAFADASPAGPIKIDLADQADVIGQVAAKAKSTTAIDPSRKIVVDGDLQVGVQQLTAQTIVFKPNARLIFNDQSPNAAGQFFIIADRIEVQDPLKPGVITWVRSVPAGPPDRGQATPGSNGGSVGARGATGNPGAAGNEGTAGSSAPALTLFVRTIATGGLTIDFRGGDGGAAGVGQSGGNGGAGAQGDGARQARSGLPFGGTLWQPWCESGPGRGGDGGAGGLGGPGGLGGKGGRGGNVTLASVPSNLPALFQAIRVNEGGGAGGLGGAAGAGGQGGAGGPEGPLANFCNSSGRNGSPGTLGATGVAGSNGEIGTAGQPFVASVTDEQFKTWFGFN